MNDKAIVIPRKITALNDSLSKGHSTRPSVTASVVLLPRIKKQSVLKCNPITPSVNPVIKNVRDGSNSSLQEKSTFQTQETRVCLPRYHPSQGLSSIAPPSYILRKRTSSKESGIITEGEEWSNEPVKYCTHSQYTVNTGNAIHRAEYKRQDSTCSSCGGSMSATTMSAGSMRRCSAVEVEVPDEKSYFKGSLQQMRDAYNTYDTDDTVITEASEGTSKILLGRLKKQEEELKQVKRERNLLRDLMFIMYERELIAEDVRLYCKRALELCGKNTDKK